MLQQIVMQILLAPVFLIVCLVIFTSPGALFLKKLKVENDDFLEKFLLSTVLGLVVFTLLTYGLALIHLRLLIWLWVGLGLVFALMERGNLWKPTILPVSRWFWAVLIVGVTGQVAVNAPTGLKYEQGIYFWSSHGHDGIWHLSLMDEFHKGVVPLQNPEYAGHTLQNYHFFVDLLMSEVTRLFPFTNLDVYFRFMPMVFSLLLGLAGFCLIRRWTKQEGAGIWAMVFTYFCGSFGFLLTIPRNHNLSGESIFWVSQTQSVLGNPPHASAFIILTTFLFVLHRYFETRSKQLLPILILLGGSIIEFKVYGGLLVLGGLLVVLVLDLLRKKNLGLLPLTVGVWIVSLGIYLPNSQNSQDFVIWQPWWFIRTMVVASDRLNWLDMELRRQTYIAEHNLKRVIQLETEAFLIFIAGNLGMRILGFIAFWQMLRRKISSHYFEVFFLSITTASFLIPVFFVQRGVAWNVIQFNQYFLLLFGFLAAISMHWLLGKVKSKTWRVALVSVVVVLAIPTQVGLLLQFYTNKPLSMVSNQELSALDFLHKNLSPQEMILTAPFDGYSAAGYARPPIPIYAWYDTGYVPAFSGRRTFLSDSEQLTIMGYQIEDKLRQRELLFQSKDLAFIQKYFQDNNIHYIYLVWNQQFKVNLTPLGVSTIFENDQARVLKIDHSVLDSYAEVISNK